MDDTVGFAQTAYMANGLGALGSKHLDCRFV